MTTLKRSLQILGSAALVGGFIAAMPVMAQAANPCAAKPANPCAPKAANPCAPKK